MADDKLRFEDLTIQNGEIVSSRRIELAKMWIRSCPFLIMVPEHYNLDTGVCRCTDPDHIDMKHWGYIWSTTHDKWVAAEECCVCGEPILNDMAEMAYRRTNQTDEEWLVQQEMPQGICHVQCGLDAGMDIA